MIGDDKICQDLVIREVSKGVEAVLNANHYG